MTMLDRPISMQFAVFLAHTRLVSQAHPTADRHDFFRSLAWQGLQVDEIVVNHGRQPFT